MNQVRLHFSFCLSVLSSIQNCVVDFVQDQGTSDPKAKLQKVFQEGGERSKVKEIVGILTDTDLDINSVNPEGKTLLIEAITASV